MGKTREIKGRMKAVGNIKRITRTMQLIATARYQAAFRRVVASRPFTQKLGELVGELSSALAAAGQSSGGFSHPLLQAPATPTGRELLLIITSNRGLCGGYNGKIFHAAREHWLSQTDRTLDLELVGKKGQAILRFNKREVAAFHAQFGDKPAYDEVEKLADRYMAEFTQGRYDAVRVAYMAFQSAGRQFPRVMQLLPMEDPTKSELGATTQALPEAGSQAGVTYDFSPDPQELLHELLPMTVRTMLFQAFNEAILSEQVARMVAMKAATDAAGKMGKLLTRQYNRARQTAITTELMEVISGAAALG